jgi:hypothetical protein
MTVTTAPRLSTYTCGVWRPLGFAVPAIRIESFVRYRGELVAPGQGEILQIAG